MNQLFHMRTVSANREPPAYMDRWFFYDFNYSNCQSEINPDKHPNSCRSLPCSGGGQ